MIELVRSSAVPSGIFLSFFDYIKNWQLLCFSTVSLVCLLFAEKACTGVLGEKSLSHN
jgi:hypothetical protein